MVPMLCQPGTPSSTRQGPKLVQGSARTKASLVLTVWSPTPELSAPGAGLTPTILGIVTLAPGHSNQACVQHYSNPARQGFCCGNAHAFHQLSCIIVGSTPELSAPGAGLPSQYQVLSPLLPAIRIKHACSTTRTQPGKAFASPKGNASN